MKIDSAHLFDAARAAENQTVHATSPEAMLLARIASIAGDLGAGLLERFDEQSRQLRRIADSVERFTGAMADGNRDEILDEVLGVIDVHAEHAEHEEGMRDPYGKMRKTIEKLRTAEEG